MKPKARLLFPFLAFSLCAFTFLSEPARGVMMQDEPSGFRGNAWGAAPGDCPSLRFVGDQGTTNRHEKPVTIYDRSTAGLTINGVTFSRIRYRFIADQLESVQLTYEGRANRTRLLQVMEERYGHPAPGERRHLGHVEWDGNETIVDLDYRVDTEQGSLWFISTSLNQEFAW
jgi:hypothetical protein